MSAAERITDALFSGDATKLSASDLEQLQQDGLPSSELDLSDLPETLTQLLADVGMATSGKQVKDALREMPLSSMGRLYR